jgi:hypothetical protein
LKELATMADVENEHRREEDERLDAEHPDTERLDTAPVEHDEVWPVYLRLSGAGESSAMSPTAHQMQHFVHTIRKLTNPRSKSSTP